jgi:hypothetical protein
LSLGGIQNSSRPFTGFQSMYLLKHAPPSFNQR